MADEFGRWADGRGVLREEVRTSAFVVAARRIYRDLTSSANHWDNMAVEEKVPVLRTMLEAVYVEVEKKLVLGLKAKAPFISVLRLCNQAVRLIDEEGELLVDGDPEGAEVRQCPRRLAPIGWGSGFS